MPDTLAVTPLNALVPLASIAEQAREYAARSKGASTLRAYAADWSDFEAWCWSHSMVALPALPATLSLYLADLAQRRKTSTLQRRLAAISQAHQAAGYADINPCRDGRLREVWKGIRRVHGVAPTRKAPALTADIRAMVDALPGNLLGTRDRALLLLGFAGAFRRSELVALNIADVAFARDGLVVALRWSKTDQEGEGATLGVPFGSNPATCPVRAIEAWLRTAGISEGPLFRPVDRWGRLSNRRLSGDAVALVVKRAVKAVGFEPARFAGHSLRAGFGTQAALEDVPEREAMAHMRQKSVNVHRGYVRVAGLFKRNPAARLGL